MEILMLIFERDFVDYDNFKVNDGDFNIVKENKKTITANVILSVTFNDGVDGYVELTKVVYKKEWLESIQKMEEYQKEIENNL